jgi:hypothetical protein
MTTLANVGSVAAVSSALNATEALHDRAAHSHACHLKKVFAPSAFWKRPTIQMKMAGSLSAADATIASIATA